MKTIIYNNKEYKLPFEVGLSDDPTATETIANRFSGEKVEPVSYTHLTLPTKLEV